MLAPFLAGGRKLRALLRRLTPPLAETTSFERSPRLAASIDRTVEVFPAAKRSFLQPRAVPQTLSYEFAPRVAYLLRGATFWPSWGVAEFEGKLVEESAFSPARMQRLIRGGMVKKGRISRMSGVCTTLHVGLPWHSHFHWLIDSLPRVYALHHPLLREIDRIDLLLAVTLKPEEDQLLRALLPANVHVRVVDPAMRVKPDQFLFLPFLSSDSNGYLPAPYLTWFRERACDVFGITPAARPAGRVFMSRRNAPKRQLTNEAQVIAALRPLGFESYALETLPLRDQIELFVNAGFAAGPHGAAFANLIFMREGNTIEICSHKDPLHFRYLAAGVGLSYGQVVDRQAPRNGDITVPVEDVVAQVEEMLAVSAVS